MTKLQLKVSSAHVLEFKELTGGITNRNYKITADGERFVLRLGGNETQFLGIDRKIEYDCSALAWQVGVAPEPIAFLEPEGYILASFVSGKGISAEKNWNRRKHPPRRGIHEVLSRTGFLSRLLLPISSCEGIHKDRPKL